MIDIVRSIGLFGFANKGTTSSEKNQSQNKKLQVFIFSRFKMVQS